MIYGERIRFRAPERSDIARFVEWFNIPEVREGLVLFLPMSTWEEETWFAQLANRPAVERPFMIEVQCEGEWTAIGNCGYHNVDWIVRSAELGIAIGDRSAWNQGYGTDAMRLLLRFGFQELGLHRIHLRVHGDNLRAVRCYEKAGFQLEGRLRDGVYKHGQWVDLLLMSVLRPEWQG